MVMADGDTAAIELHRELAPKISGLVAVGVGGVDGDPVLVIYVLKSAKVDPAVVPAIFAGHRVKLVKMARPVPA